MFTCMGFQSCVCTVLHHEPDAVAQGLQCSCALHHPAGTAVPLVPGVCATHLCGCLLWLQEEGEWEEWEWLLTGM